MRYILTNLKKLPKKVVDEIYLEKNIDEVKNFTHCKLIQKSVNFLFCFIRCLSFKITKNDRK